MAERVNHMVKGVIQMAVQNSKGVRETVEEMVWAYNTTENGATGDTPFMRMRGGKGAGGFEELLVGTQKLVVKRKDGRMQLGLGKSMTGWGLIQRTSGLQSVSSLGVVPDLLTGFHVVPQQERYVLLLLRSEEPLDLESLVGAHGEELPPGHDNGRSERERSLERDPGPLKDRGDLLKTGGNDRATEGKACLEVLRGSAPGETSGLGPGIVHKAAATRGAEWRPGCRDLRKVFAGAADRRTRRKPGARGRPGDGAVSPEAGGQGGSRFLSSLPTAARSLWEREHQAAETFGGPPLPSPLIGVQLNKSNKTTILGLWNWERSEPLA
ncbi:hypothetical protein NDU88_002775 [Pleurodeles waltl]|uniref:Uncharacterized protein n=1 Tax=Pleurodeles waltl TaxID=8319 RepID=A0AAV7TLI0_PLEWA|nr:hypothetical protein NDU88_002775 [Pleurodeles waltl]